ncbi:amino acid--[acyl-carrier-protein] ligase [Parafrigoribacterium soli]|uniref:amino acid--[acyl-carrier-protein] ligase n=1 Tax=Parafrigoribacterium soli TaxID=3144663 RepID=UPI0032EC3BA0
MTDAHTIPAEAGDAADAGGALEIARREFRAEILASGMLVDAGLPGLYGRSGLFEDLVDAVAAHVVSLYSDQNASRLRFAPVIARPEYERTDYIVSFPHLSGTINGFFGSDAEHKGLVAARAEGKTWDSWLSPAETALVPAVCHPLYERLRGTVPAAGSVFDLLGFCFRHEPSHDPMRLQVFRQQEFVFVGEEAAAKAFRDEMCQRQLEGLRALGLDAELVPANDPFFGRTGRFLARNQLADEAKLEVVVKIYGDLDEGTAVASGNQHGDHFGAAFSIQTSDGSVAHSSCLGWGLERIVLALLRTHGTDLATWPDAVRSELRLDPRSK